MGFSIRLAPGVRVRASSRGVRASVGPRAARVHVGGGRAGISTGAGPVGFYTSLGGGRRGSGRGGGAASYQRQFAAQQRQTARSERAEEARRLADIFLRILTIHRVEFPPATAPVAPPPAQPDRAAIYQHYEQQALAGIGRFKRAQRSEAKQRAAAWADTECQRQWAEACAQHEQLQQYLSQRWQQLCRNDPEVVMHTLEEAFEDNEAPAAVVGVDGSDLSLVVLVPAADEIVPERMPTTTQAGNLSLKKLAQRDRADYYKQFVAGQVLVTVREALAVAPGIMATRVVVLRNDGQDAYGGPRVSCVLAAKLDRHSLLGVQWDSADAVKIIDDAATEKLINQKGRTQELTALDLSREPDITHLINQVDLHELTAPG